MRPRAVFALPCALLCGCSLLYPTTRPIPAVWHRASPAPGAAPGPRTLVVLWPGRGDAPEDFVEAGFVDIAQRALPGADAVCVDAHFGYYLEQTVLARVHDDVIAPARAQGYARILLVGISMGGLGVLMYHNEYPDTVDGVLALAPFLGDDEVLDEVRAAGGLAGFQPAAPPAREDYQRALWYGLRRQLAPGARPPVLLGFGTDDSFAEGCELLAACLPPARIFRVPGGHEWAPWRELLAAALASGALDAGSTQILPPGLTGPRPE